MKVKRKLAAGLLVLSATTALAGCGNNTNHDAQNPDVDIALQWWRVETPPSVVTLYFACFGTTSLLIDQSDGNTTTTPDDPMCPKGGEPYKLVKRNGSDPAIIIGTYRLVPPDSTGEYAGSGSS